MLVVMLMLLVGTTLASMTVHAITLELRSAGYYRQQAQTHYVAESALQGVLSIPANNIWERVKELRRTTGLVPLTPEPADITDPNLMRNYGEPDPALIIGGQRPVLRMSSDMVNTFLLGLPAGGGQPVMQGFNESLGAQAFTPWYVVDLTDIQVDSSGQTVGGNVGSSATEVYFIATVTVRGRTMLDDGLGNIAADRGRSSTVVGDMFQQFTDAAYDMRTVVRFGPVPP